MNIAICDDEPVFLKKLYKKLTDMKIPDCRIHEFTSGKELLKLYVKGMYEVVILDVEMPNMDGIKLGEALRKQNKQIVLIYLTAHSQYLDSALNLNASRFFEKPIDKARFFNGIDNALERIDNSSISFYIRDDKTQVRISAENIVYVEIERRKTKIVTDEKEYCTTHTLDYFKERLVSSVFAQPHKSYIVNLNYITAYERTGIVLDDKYKIPVSRSKQTEFHTAFIRFMEGK